jgi:hypothetical protein
MTPQVVERARPAGVEDVNFGVLGTWATSGVNDRDFIRRFIGEKNSAYLGPDGFESCYNVAGMFIEILQTVLTVKAPLRRAKPARP